MNVTAAIAGIMKLSLPSLTEVANSNVFSPLMRLVFFITNCWREPSLGRSKSTVVTGKPLILIVMKSIRLSIGTFLTSPNPR